MSGFGLEGVLDDVQQSRKLLMTPCATREGLRDWLVTYLNLDLPDTLVDESSTGSPLDEMWRIYHAGVTNDPEFPRRSLLYASRGSYKTLGVAVLELLAMLHMDRSVVHLAAIEQQAGKAQEYLRGFLGREGLDEFGVGNNKRSVAVVWAEHKATGDLINNEEWRALDRIRKREYTYHARYVKVIVNTPASSNSDHVAFFVVDEVDLIRFPLAYEEAKLIPEAQRSADGVEQPPLTILTSSRKYSGGLVQREIDEAEKTGTAVRHWNVLDVTRRCPDSRHMPAEPLVPVFTSDVDLKVIDPDEYARLVQIDEKRALDYTASAAYAGCISNCRIYAACKGRLARVTSQAGMLKSLDDTIGKFRDVSVEMAIAQLMCWKPGNEGSIFKHFSKRHHMLSLADMWETVTGEKPPPRMVVTKQALIDMLIARKVKWAVGMDFGFTHVFAVCLFAIDGRRAFLIDAFEIAQLELNQKIELCDKRLGAYKKLSMVVWPDPAYPSDIKTFRSKGYVMKTHTKDVLAGINAVRNKLNPPGSKEPELFMLKDDAAGELMAKRFESARWKLDAQGRPTDVPDDFEDDLMDATKYIIQNEFRGAGKVVVGKKEQEPEKPVVLTPKTWMAAKVQELTGGQGGEVVTSKRVKRGGFMADFG